MNQYNYISTNDFEASAIAETMSQCVGKLSATAENVPLPVGKLSATADSFPTLVGTHSAVADSMPTTGDLNSANSEANILLFNSKYFTKSIIHKINF